MKKIFTLFFALVMMSEGFSQTIANWNFATSHTTSVTAFSPGFVIWNLDGQTINSNLTSYLTGMSATAAWSIDISDFNYTGYYTNSTAITASYFNNSAVPSSRWLVTPSFTVPTTSTAPNVGLVWYAQSLGEVLGETGYDDNYRVLVSTTDSLPSSFTPLLTVNGETGSTHALPLAAYAGQTIRIAFQDTCVNEFGLIIPYIQVTNLPAAAISVNDVEIYEHNYLNNPVTVTGLFTNTGLDNINTYVLNYSVNGGATVSSPVNYNAGILSQQQYIYTHPVPFNPSTAGTYTVSVWFSDLNGTSATSDTSSVTVFFYPEVPGITKNVVLEEMTGAGCPWCPGGALALRDLHNALPYVIPVAIHSGDINDLNVSPSDAMQITAGQTVVDACASGFPTGMVDRLYSFDNQTISPSFINDFYKGPSQITNDIWYNLSVLRKFQATPLNVTLSGITYDTTTSSVTVTVNANFVNSLSQGTYNINLYVVEDSVLTPSGNNGNGYNQDNGAYSSAGGQTTNYNELYNLPAVLTDNGQTGQYAQNHVLRTMAGGAWGTTGVIPSSPSAGNTYSHTYTFSVPSTWRPDYLKLVGLVQEYSTNVNLRTVLNAAEANLVNAPRNCPVIAVSASQVGTTPSAFATASGGTAPYTYNWSASQSTDTATGLTVGTNYTVTATDFNGCTGLGYVTIAPASCPTITATIALHSSTSSATVSASGGASPYTYLWNTTPAQTSATATSLTPGVTYTVTAIDNNGCTASTSASIDVCSTINSFVTQIGTTTAATVATAGGAYPYSYTWSTTPVQNGDTATGLIVGNTYSVTVRDNNGCSASGAVTLEAACPAITATATQVGGSSAFAAASGGAGPYVYTWSNGQATDTASLLNTGSSYTVTAIDNNGCTGTATISIVAGIRSIGDITDFSVYPNPSFGIFTASIHLAAPSAMTITITDLTGNNIYESSENKVKDLEKTINVGRVAAGMYFVSVKTSQGTANQRIIIK